MPNYRRHQEPGGTYFFTVVAAGREPIFTQEGARIALNTAIQAVRKEHPFKIDAWVLLPDHLHCIWSLPEDDADYPIRWAKIKRRRGTIWAWPLRQDSGSPDIGNTSSAMTTT